VRVAIGIISYFGKESLEACLTSLVETVDIDSPDVKIFLWDNSDWDETNVELAKRIIPSITARYGFNCGCSIPRNFFYFAARRKYPYLAIADQDVVFLPGWLESLLEVMNEHSDAAVATFPVCNFAGAPLLSDDGEIAYCPSVLYLHRVTAMDQVAAVAPFGVPYDPRFFFYRFETLFHAWLLKLRWKIYVDMKHYCWTLPAEMQQGGIIHIAMHEGIRRNPKWREYYRVSEELYRKTIKELNLPDPLLRRRQDVR